MSSHDAVYLRISEDQDGLEAGVERQREDSIALARAEGVDISDDAVFVDNDISASTLSTKIRPNWDRLVEQIKAGQVKRVWAYSNSRMTRRPRELEDLIDMHAQFGVVFHTVKSGQYDLSTADGRMQARILASIDAGEAERISERVTSQKRQRAMQGKPQGGRTRLYGYTSTWEQVPNEAAVIKEAFTRRAAGESINSIAIDFATRGLRTAEFTCKFHTARFEASGKERPSSVPASREDCDKCRDGLLWKSGTLLTTLRNPTYAGLRSYKGEVVGKMYDGFPAVVSEDIFNAAVAVTAAKPKSVNSRRYLLSGFTRCGMCMGRMTGRPAKARAPRYRCAASQGGCGVLSIRQDWLDDPVYQAVVMYEVSNRHNNRDTQPETDHAANNAEIERIRSEMTAVKDGIVAGAISAATGMSIISGLERALSEAQSVSRKAGAAAASENWIYRTVAELDDLSLGEKRALIGKWVEFIKVDPAPTKGRNEVDLSRIEVHFTDGTVERLSNTVPSHPLVNDVE